MPDPRSSLPQLSSKRRALLARTLRKEQGPVLLSEPIALVGMACRLPGDVDGPEAFWQRMAQGGDAIAEIPAGRWDLDAYYDPDPDAPGKMCTRRAGMLAHVERFDADFFGISPRESRQMDPQQRILLEVAWEALESAGLTRARLSGSRTGVFVGNCGSDYALMQFEDLSSIDAYVGTGSRASILSNRISYVFNLRGPSVTVDTACSSSLVALHMACQSLRTGETDFALTGGVNLILTPEMHIVFSKARILSPEGRCATFDRSASGYVRAEGCGMVVLRRLSDALGANDPIFAVIRGTAVNQDGRTNGLSAPSGLAQEAVILQALDDAGLPPSQISLIEAHGTGTVVGDAIELEALAKIYGKPGGEACALGAVKTNIGHLEAAAGIAGVIKVALCMQHREVPPHLHLSELNPSVALGDTRFAITTERRGWPSADGQPRCAAVSAFGFGGTNAHVILEEPPAPAVPALPEGAQGPVLLPLSARSPAALVALARAHEARLASTDAGALADLVHTAATRRDHHPFRLAVVGETPADLAARLSAITAEEGAAPLSAGALAPSPDAPLTFVFSGQGSQWWGMGRALLSQDPAFRAEVEACDAHLRRLGGPSILDALTADEASSRLSETEIAQPTIFAVQAGLVATLRELGIRPDTVVGHSVGEVAAAYVGGVLSLEDAARVVYHRSRLMQQAPGTGAMASVALSAEAARALLRGREDRIEIAAVNGPASTVLSGDAEALDHALRGLEARGVHVQRLQVAYAFHSFQMEPFGAELTRQLDGLAPRPPSCLVMSTVTGAPLAEGDYGAAYWGRNVRRTVLFADAIAHLVDSGHRTFLEVGPHPVLSGWAAEILRVRGAVGRVAGTLHRKKGDRAALLEALGALYTAGYDLDWNKLYPSGRCVPLPAYPFQREPYWIEPTPARARRRTTPRAGRGSPHALLGDPLPVATAAGEAQVWEFELAAEGPYALGDHRVRDVALFPAAGYVDLAFGAARRLAPDAPWGLEQLEILAPLNLPEQGPRRAQLTLTPGAGGALSMQVFSAEHAAAGDASPWILHATGVLRQHPEAAPPARFDVAHAGHAGQRAAIEARCAEALDAAEHYARMADRGLHYGPAYQGIAALRRRDGEALARVVRTDAAAAEARRSVLHPALLDACFQALAAAMPASEAREATYLPVGVGSVRLHAPPPDALWVHVVLGEARPGEPAAADLRLFEESGALVAELRDFRVQRLRRRPSDLRDAVYEVRWVAAQRRAPEAFAVAFPEPGAWVLLADEGGVGAALRATLLAQGERCHLVRTGPGYRRLEPDLHEVDPACVEDFRRLLEVVVAEGPAGCRGVVFLWPLDAAPEGDAMELDVLRAAQQRGSAAALSLVQALAAADWAVPPRLWLVTRGAQPVGGEAPVLAHAPLWGLGRVIAQEHPKLGCTLVDLGRGDNEAAALFTELCRTDHEDQIALRGGARYLARLTQATRDELFQAGAPEPAGDRPFRLEIDRSGVLDRLALCRMTRPSPGPRQIVIEVHAAGLNFLDVLQALGTIPDDVAGADARSGPRLGGECAGRVVALGEGVAGLADLHLGQRVAAIGFECFGSYAITSALLAAPIPDSMSFTEAATVPVVFLTAFYALTRVARLAPGERVLIHAATGGVGLAAVQIAQHLGAEVIATAGNPDKRALLQRLGVRHVTDSRSLRFAEEVLAMTGGEGVDVVLNSLAGEFIPKSFALLRSYGRFVEIGKRDYYEDSKLGLRPFLKNLTFSLVDLRGMSVERPDLVQGLLRELMALFERGALRPIQAEVFPISRAVDAFRHMAQGRHVGKIVLSMPAPDAPTLPGRRLSLREDGTYLITGGLGGLGLRAAAWMVQRGARHLALLGRSAPPSAQRGALAALERAGARVSILRADVAVEAEVRDALAAVRQGGPPLRGVLHAAGLLDDATLVNLDAHRLRRVLDPKLGAWNLHRHTLDDPLDFFVLFSSAAAVLGSPGQGNYAAANAFLDALAHARRRRGLPALSLGWGAWAEVGMAAAEQHRGARLEALGTDPIAVAEGLEALGALVSATSPGGAPAAHLAVLPIDWKRWAQAYPGAAVQPLLTDLMTVGAGGGSRQGAARAAIEDAPPHERLSRALDHLIDQIAAVVRAPKARIDPRRAIADLGFDSLMGVELRNRLEVGLGVAIPLGSLRQNATIASLAELLLDALGLRAGPAPTAAPAAPAAALPVDVAGLSDAQVDALLAEMLTP